MPSITSHQIHNAYPFQWLKVKRLPISSFGVDVEQPESQMGMQNCITTLKNGLVVFYKFRHACMHVWVLSHFSCVWLRFVWCFGASLVLRCLSVCMQFWRPGLNPCVGEIPWRMKWQPTQVLLPGKFHGWRNLVGYSPWGHKESDATELLHLCDPMGHSPPGKNTEVSCHLFLQGIFLT